MGAQNAIHFVRSFHLENGIGALRHWSAGHNPDRLTRLDFAGEMTSWEGTAADCEIEWIVLPCPKRLAADQGVTVHGRAIEVWNINRRGYVVRKNTLGRIGYSNHLRGQSSHPRTQHYKNSANPRPTPTPSHPNALCR